MQKIVGVRRDKEKVLYYFLENIEDLKLGDKVVVDFGDFQTVVEVAKLGMNVSDDKAFELKKILRRANEFDISKYESLRAKAKAFLPEIKKKSLALGLMMKFVSAEYSLDASKILIVFSSEERVDFRQLLKEIAVMLKARIELKQIGQRDEIKLCGAVGQCGQPCCCARFLNDFEHVTVKMAKIQGLSLSPTKINGICGRLLCCLGYESPMYEKLIEKMPKVGSEIKTPKGIGNVVYNDILRERVSVKIKADGDTFVVEDFSLEELKEAEKLDFSEQEKAQSEIDKAEEFILNGHISSQIEEQSKNVEVEKNSGVVENNSPKDTSKKQGEYNKEESHNSKNFNKDKNSQKFKNNNFDKNKNQSQKKFGNREFNNNDKK